MRKIKLFSLVALCSTLLFSVGAYADTISNSGFHRGSTYSEDVVGSSGTMHAEGTTTYAYTTVYNTTTSTLYMEATVKEYIYDEGFINSKSDYGNIEPGRIADSENLAREIANSEKDYYHTGYVYNAASMQSGVRDNLTYIAYQ